MRVVLLRSKFIILQNFMILATVCELTLGSSVFSAGCACLYAIVLHSDHFCTGQSTASSQVASRDGIVGPRDTAHHPSNLITRMSIIGAGKEDVAAKGVAQNREPGLSGLTVEEDTKLVEIRGRDPGASSTQILVDKRGWRKWGKEVVSGGDGGVERGEREAIRSDAGGGDERSPFVGPDGLVVWWLKVQSVTDLVVPLVSPLLALTGVEFAWQARCVQYLGECCILFGLSYTCVFLVCLVLLKACVGGWRVPAGCPHLMCWCVPLSVQRRFSSLAGLSWAVSGPSALGERTKVEVVAGLSQGCRQGVETAAWEIIQPILSCGGSALCGLRLSG